jgi:hypothetical protein
MTSKHNIFASLPQHVDSDEEVQTRTKKTEKKDVSKTEKPKPARTGATGTQKEEHSRLKEPKKEKGVSAQPHPLDRHSGTGNQAYGAKPKKGGAGKGNWGNYKDERKPREEGAVEEGAEATEETPVEEEKPTGLTLQEYYAQQKVAQNEPQINEAKAKITAEQLKKELGTATLLKTRQQQEIDDKKVGKKKGTLDVNHHAAITTEHANLLNFRTGFVEREYRSRNPEDAADAKRSGPRAVGKGEKERENAKEEEAKPQGEVAQPADAKPTGEEFPEGTPGEQAESPKRRGDGGRGGRGGHRGGRKPYGGKQGADQAKINFEDESAFPKLG